MDDLPSRVVHVIVSLILAGLLAVYVSWWAAAVGIVIGVVVLVKPSWGGESWWSF